MPTVPTGALTFGQIRDLALRRAGNQSLTYDASVWLSQLLYDLYTQWDWPFLMQQTTIILLGPQFTLPPDWLKMQDDNAFAIVLFDNQAQNQQFIKEKDPFTFAAVTQANATGGFPQIWTAQRATGVGQVFPDPTGHVLQCTFRYKLLPTADTTPPPVATPNANDALLPTFPWGLYLVQALFTLVLQYDADPRADNEMVKTDAMLERIRRVAMPLRSVETMIPLDDDIFGPTFTSDI